MSAAFLAGIAVACLAIWALGCIALRGSRPRTITDAVTEVDLRHAPVTRDLDEHYQDARQLNCRWCQGGIASADGGQPPWWNKPCTCGSDCGHEYCVAGQGAA